MSGAYVQYGKFKAGIEDSKAQQILAIGAIMIVGGVAIALTRNPQVALAVAKKIGEIGAQAAPKLLENGSKLIG